MEEGFGDRAFDAAPSGLWEPGNWFFLSLAWQPMQWDVAPLGLGNSSNGIRRRTDIDPTAKRFGGPWGPNGIFLLSTSLPQAKRWDLRPLFRDSLPNELKNPRSWEE